MNFALGTPGTCLRREQTCFFPGWSVQPKGSGHWHHTVFNSLHACVRIERDTLVVPQSVPPPPHPHPHSLCGVVWCGVVWCGVVWCGVVWCGWGWVCVERGESSEETRRHVGSPRRFTPELLDEIREFIEEEHVRISLKIVSNRFTLSRTSSRNAIRLLRLRPLVIRTVPHLQDRHIRDRRKVAAEMLARLALASGRRISRKISTSRRLDLDVICFSDEKISRVDSAAPGRSFHTFYLGKVERRDNATPLPFRDTPCVKGGRVVTSPHF